MRDAVCQTFRLLPVLAAAAMIWFLGGCQRAATVDEAERLALPPTAEAAAESTPPDSPVPEPVDEAARAEWAALPAEASQRQLEDFIIAHPASPEAVAARIKRMMLDFTWLDSPGNGNGAWSDAKAWKGFAEAYALSDFYPSPRDEGERAMLYRDAHPSLFSALTRAEDPELLDKYVAKYPDSPYAAPSSQLAALLRKSSAPEPEGKLSFSNEDLTPFTEERLAREAEAPIEEPAGEVLPAGGAAKPAPKSAGGSDPEMMIERSVLEVTKVHQEEDGEWVTIGYRIRNASKYDIAFWELNVEFKGGFTVLGRQTDSGNDLKAGEEANDKVYFRNDARAGNVKWDPKIGQVFVMSREGKRVNATKFFTVRAK